MPKPVPGLGQNPSTQQIAEALGVFTGERGDKLDQAVTFRDLKEKGVLRLRSGTNQVRDPDRDLEGPDQPPSKAVPPQPSGLTGASAIQNNILEWDSPFTAYANHAHTEIWRHDADNLANATRVGTSDSSLYADNVGETASTRYYWVRFVSTAGIKGPYNAAAGTPLTTKKVEDKDILEIAADKVIANELAAISANLGSITAGSLNINNRFIVSSTGDVDIISSSTGARMEVSNEFIKVFDSNGTKRVQLGDLTA